MRARPQPRNGFRQRAGGARREARPPAGAPKRAAAVAAAAAAAVVERALAFLALLLLRRRGAVAVGGGRVVLASGGFARIRRPSRALARLAFHCFLLVSLFGSVAGGWRRRGGARPGARARRAIAVTAHSRALPG